MNDYAVELDFTQAERLAEKLEGQHVALAPVDPVILDPAPVELPISPEQEQINELQTKALIIDYSKFKPILTTMMNFKNFGRVVDR